MNFEQINEVVYQKEKKSYFLYCVVVGKMFDGELKFVGCQSFPFSILVFLRVLLKWIIVRTYSKDFCVLHLFPSACTWWLKCPEYEDHSFANNEQL